MKNIFYIKPFRHIMPFARFCLKSEVKCYFKAEEPSVIKMPGTNCLITSIWTLNGLRKHDFNIFCPFDINLIRNCQKVWFWACRRRQCRRFAKKPYLVWRCDEFLSNFQLGRFWCTQSGVNIDPCVEPSWTRCQKDRIGPLYDCSRHFPWIARRP